MSRPYYTVQNFEAMNSIGYLMKRCTGLMMVLAENAFEGLPLSFTQWIVLMNLMRFQSHMSATALSKETGHDMGALTRVVDTLEKAGLVKRERSLNDRRAVEIALTAAGRRQVESTKCLVMEMTNELLEPFSYEECHTLVTLLQRLFARLQEFSGLAPDEMPHLAVRKPPSRRRSPSRDKS